MFSCQVNIDGTKGRLKIYQKQGHSEISLDSFQILEKYKWFE